MPELPEVETIKRSLEPNIVNKTISKIIILSPKNFVGNKNQVIGNKIVSIKRYGKVLVIKTKNKSNQNVFKYLNIHFKLSGQMLYSDNINNAVYINKIPFTKGNSMPGKTTRVIIKFIDNSCLFFNDLRKFGWIKISDIPHAPKGIDVLSRQFSEKSLISKTNRSIKQLLMDQNIITGIGNIYANDSLFLSKIHPLRKASTLTISERKNLFNAILKEINKGIKDKGSSGKDEAFILPDGTRGKHQRSFLVYQRENMSCLRCKTKIKRIKQNGRSSFFCPQCQKLYNSKDD